MGIETACDCSESTQGDERAATDTEKALGKHRRHLLHMISGQAERSSGSAKSKQRLPTADSPIWMRRFFCQIILMQN
jgi:hypothetical protein